jgi:hypothetical protein
MKRKFLPTILITSLLALSSQAMAQQQCKNIFLDPSQKIIQELAQLKVESETAPSIGRAQMLQGLYNTKYALAKKSNLDLSQLPQFVEEMRRQQGQQLESEGARLKEIGAREKKALQGELFKQPFNPGIESENLKFSADGRYFIVWNLSVVEVYETSLKARVASFSKSGDENFQKPTLNADGSKMMNGFFNKKKNVLGIQLWDVKTQKVEKTLVIYKVKYDEDIHFQWSEDGTRVLTKCRWEKLLLWNLNQITEEEVNLASLWGAIKLRMYKDKVQAFEDDRWGYLSPDGKKLLIVKSNRPSLWNEDSSGQWHELPLDSVEYFAEAQFLPDSSKVMIWDSPPYASSKKVMSAWDTQTGQHLFDFQDQNKNFYGRIDDVSRDGAKILTYGEFNGPQPKAFHVVWDANTGTVSSVLFDDAILGPESIQSAKFNFDGNLVLQLIKDGRLLLWSSTGPLPLFLTESKQGRNLYASSPQNIFVTSPDDRNKNSTWNFFTFEPH